MAGYLSGLTDWALAAQPPGAVQPRPRQPFERGQRSSSMTALDWTEEPAAAQPVTDLSESDPAVAVQATPVQSIPAPPFRFAAPPVAPPPPSVRSPISERLSPDRSHPDMRLLVSPMPLKPEPVDVPPAVQYGESPPPSALPTSALRPAPVIFNLPPPPPHPVRPIEPAPIAPVAPRWPARPPVFEKRPVGELRPQAAAFLQPSRLDRAVPELASPEPPQIQVTIGRLEVRLSGGASPAPVRSSAPTPSGPTLGDYLQGRDRRRP